MCSTIPREGIDLFLGWDFGITRSHKRPSGHLGEELLDFRNGLVMEVNAFCMGD